MVLSWSWISNCSLQWAESWAIQHRGVALKWWNELCVCYARNTSCIQNSLYFWWEKGNDWLRLQNPNVFQISSHHCLRETFIYGMNMLKSWPLSWAHGGLWSSYMKNFLASLVQPRQTTFLLISMGNLGKTHMEPWPITTPNSISLQHLRLSTSHTFSALARSCFILRPWKGPATSTEGARLNPNTKASPK